MAKQGDRLSKVRLVARIAVGGMAEVFQGVGKQGPVAVKVVLPQHSKDEAFVRAFAHEAALAGQLEHPGIVKVHGFEPGPPPHIVMELVDGLALKELVARLDTAGAIDVALQLLDALGYAHQAKDHKGQALSVVHRDLSPLNVLVRRDGRVKLTDFGIARSKLRETRTRTGLVKGNLRYLSPEQATGSDLDHRSDIYGVGLLLFEMLTGAPYLSAERDVELLREAEEPTKKLVSANAPELEVFDDVVGRALARFPEQRFGSCSAFAEALRRAASKAGIEPSDAALRAAIADSLPHEQKKTFPLRAALMLAGVVGASTAVAVSWQTSSPAGAETEAVEGRPSHEPQPRHPREGVELDPGDNEGRSPRDPQPRQPGEGGDLDPGGNEGRPARDPQPRHLREGGDLDPGGNEGRPARDPQPRHPREGGDLHASTEASSSSEETTTEPAADMATLQARLSRLETALAARGIRESDLSSAGRELLRRARATLASEDAEAEQAVSQAEARLGALRVDAALVQRKRDRVDALLRHRRDVPESIQSLAALALADVMERRYEQANRRLNRILDQLRQ